VVAAARAPQAVPASRVPAAAAEPACRIRIENFKPFKAMTKKDFLLLLSPIGFFVVIAFAAFFYSVMLKQHTKDTGHQQRFQTFAANVQSGKWKLTTDKWLEGMRHEVTALEDFRRADATTAEVFQDFILVSLGGATFQAVIVFSVLKRAKKMSRDATGVSHSH
jgi:hypothetical protein